MKSVLLYYPFKMVANANSGSKLRPIEMHKAFLHWGKMNQIDIHLIMGNSEERERHFDTLKKEGKLESLLFCYMENQTIPLWLTDPNHIPKKPFIDRKVLSYLKNHNIPTGVFYRDVYWKFDDLYPLKGIKKSMMQSIYRMEENFYEKYCEVIFLPSDSMGKYVNIKREKVALPPGGKKKEINRGPISIPLKGLYVGGINNRAYGLPLLLKSLRKFNEKEERLQLTVVCREDELEKVSPDILKDIEDLNVRILHVSGSELDEVYKDSDIAFIPREKTTYNDFSVPVKLVEYLSSGLPVVATNCDAQQDFIESGPYGVVGEPNVERFIEAIEKITENLAFYNEKIEESFLSNHSWDARVEKIQKTLLKEKL
ncbi:glycosyltransferase family 4 protein [Rossellomorea vietnamensis]|uniref:glycosyltransferase family 4 protein n=1 Tax=Rossellomorea vietnamensis TaxID=218284 RepID=UPI003D2A8306